MNSIPGIPENTGSLPGQASIALWGPSGAGKDWLLNAFARELNLVNQSENDFIYEVLESQLGGGNPVPFNPEAPRTIPSTGTEDREFVFRRIARVPDQAHQISAQTHHIMIHNDKGADLITALGDPAVFEATINNLLHSLNILLVLSIPKEGRLSSDLPAESLAPVPELEQPEKIASLEDELLSPPQEAMDISLPNVLGTDWSARDYMKFMEAFFTAIGTTPRRNLAVCMSKADLTNLKGDPWHILRRRYGEQLGRLLEVHKQHHNISIFNTSAAGYIRRNGIVLSNFESGSLRDPEHWRPVNTTAPFFWIYETIEMDRLQKGSFLFRSKNLKAYIPYPKPRSTY